MILLTTGLLWATEPFSEQEVVQAASSRYRAMRIHDILPKIPKEAYQKAAKGKVATGIAHVQGHRAKIGWGVGIVSIPIDHLFSSISEEENHIEHTAVSYAKIIEGQPCEDKRKVLMILPLPLIADRWWVTTQLSNPSLRSASNHTAAELAWKEVSQPKIKQEERAKLTGKVQVPFTQGSWFLMALDAKHTLAEYHSWVDPGGNIPAGPASQFATGSIEETFRQMEEYARGQSHSICRKSW